MHGRVVGWRGVIAILNGTGKGLRGFDVQAGVGEQVSWNGFGVGHRRAGVLLLDFGNRVVDVCERIVKLVEVLLVIGRMGGVFGGESLFDLSCNQRNPGMSYHRWGLASALVTPRICDASISWRFVFVEADMSLLMKSS